jgi:hypothetical protein
MARKKKDGYMPKSEVLLILQNYIRTIQMNDYGTDSGIPQLYKAMTYIEDAPTADVAEVRHGHWEFAGDCCVECSVCEETYIPTMLPRNFCPNCGARMDGDEGDL